MQIIEKSIESIIPYDKKPRFNDEAVKYVAESIQQFGFKVPIIIDQDNVIIAGHTRLKAAKELGYETVPCVLADDLTPEQVKAFRLADNKVAEYSEWDMDLLKSELMEIESIDMESLGFEEMEELDTAEAVDDGYDPEPPEEPISKPGEIYQLGNHRLMVGDSTKAADVEKLMDGNLADLVVTDPPYNVAIENSQGMKIENDDMDDSAFLKFLIFAFENLEKSLKPGEKVLDLFGGSGTTLIACEQMNRKCFMMEYDPKYADVIIDRWEQYTGKKAVLISE